MRLSSNFPLPHGRMETAKPSEHDNHDSGWQKPNLVKPRAYHRENKPEKANPSTVCVMYVLQFEAGFARGPYTH